MSGLRPDRLYLLLWALGAAAGAAAALWALWHRGCLTLAAAGAIGTAWEGLVVGAHLQHRLESMPVTTALHLGPSILLDAGGRLPLAMLIGAALALVWCLVFRVRLRETGDALALGGMTMAAVGRLGCILTDCCPGLICPAWAAAFCVVPGRGSAAHGLQLAYGIVTPEAAHGLPVVPLAWLFATAAAAVAVILVAMLLRGARPGAILVTACILGPMGKLVLEHLRYEPRPPVLQLGIPLVTLVVAVVVGIPWLRGARRRDAVLVTQPHPIASGRSGL